MWKRSIKKVVLPEGVSAADYIIQERNLYVKSRILWVQMLDRDYNITRLTRRMQRISRHMSGPAREDFAAYIPDWDVELFARQLREKLERDFMSTMQNLQDMGCIELLKNYKRAKKSFYISHGMEDVVSSEVMFKDGDERLRSEDYLKAFSRFRRRTGTGSRPSRCC